MVVCYNGTTLLDTVASAGLRLVFLMQKLILTIPYNNYMVVKINFFNNYIYRSKAIDQKLVHID